MALLKVDQPSETEKTDAVFEIIDAEVSAKLNNSAEAFVCEPEQEEEMLVETWMTDESQFDASDDFNEVDEETLIVEEWMINNANFSNPLVAESVDFEKPLEIEPWMTDDHFWGF